MNQSLLDVRFEDLMHVAQARAASDVHLTPGVRAAMRIDGTLEFVDGPSVSAEETALLAQRLLHETAALRLGAQGDATTTWEGHSGTTIRLHASRCATGTSLALRLLPASVPALEALHLPPVVATFVQKSRGLVIFAGPTGSGKSTSLAALVSKINATSSRRIVTIEDPIEYRHRSNRSVVSQREVGRDVSSFADAIIGVLRADPDVIVIGEMRDAATMRAAITAAETGHLVFTTVHTGDAVQTIDRIVNAFDGAEQAQVRSQLAAGIAAVVCQRLVPRAGGSGRRVAAEVLIATDAVRATIREARTHQLRNLMLSGRQSGMQTLEHHLNELLAERQINRAAAISVTERHGELREAAGAIT